MNIELSRDEQQCEKEGGKTRELGQKRVHRPGWEQSESGTKAAESQQCTVESSVPLACDLRQVSPILSLKFFLDKMGMILLVTLSFVGLTYRKTC